MKTVTTLALIICLTATLAASSNITLEVTNIGKQKGYIRAALYNETNFLDEDVYIQGDSVPVDGNRVTIAFTEIPAGTYAVAIYHDKNNNNKLDKNFVGMPKEPVAFSSGAKIKMGAPSFKSAAFQHSNTSTSVPIAF